MPDTIYTNRPEFADESGYTYVGPMDETEWEPETLEIAPGVKYTPEKRKAVEYSSEGADYGEKKKGWTFSTIVRAFPNAFNVDPEAADAIEKGEKTKLQMAEEDAATKGMTLKEYLQTPYGQLAAKYGKPPEGWGIPDYSKEGRKRFEQIAFKRAGGDPSKFDPNEEVNKASTYLPKLFNDVFRGKVLYEDRYKMSKKQKDHWNQEVNKFRAAVFQDATAYHDKMQKEYDTMINEFDRRAKEYKASMDAIDKQQNRLIDVFNPKIGVKDKMTIDEFEQAHTEDPNWTRGVPVKEEDDAVSVLDLQRLANYEMKMFDPDNLDSENRVPTTDLKHANRMRTSLGLPTLEEVAGEKPVWGPVKKFWEEKMPGILGGGEEPPKQSYEYREKVPSGGRTEQGAQVMRGKIGGKEVETAVVKPRAINPETGEQYEEGFRAIYTDPDTGIRYRVIVKNGNWDYE